MKLYDTEPRQSGDIGVFNGGMDELKDGSITKSFRKAKKMVLSRLQEEMDELQERIDTVEAMTEDAVPEILNPFW